MVAKSFQKFDIITEPYEIDDKMYVDVRNPATGNVRRAKWYTSYEYLKTYPEDEEVVRQYDKYYRTQKSVLGFDSGFIYIFSTNITEDNEWFQQNCRRLTRFWGWYYPGNETLPENFPDEVQEVYKLRWDAVGTDKGVLKSEEEVIRVVAQCRNAIDISCANGPVGTVGERLTLDVGVVSADVKEEFKGFSTNHIFEDKDKNLYVWKTSAKSWSVGDHKHIRGTVKEHSGNLTILTRCMEVK